MVKRLSTMQETWVRSLGREDLLEKEMAIHSSAIAWKIPWTEEPDRLQSMVSQRDFTSLPNFRSPLHGEGSGTPLQYSCLENPTDGGAWWVTTSRTRLSDFTFMHWRRKWQPTPVFLPGESQGRSSLVGCHLWGHTESDMTEVN